MRTFATTHTVYTFDELSKEAQQKAIDNARDNEYEVGLDWLNTDMQEQLLVLLDKHKLKGDDCQVRYSLSYSQGDGASFTGRIEYNGTWYGDVELGSLSNFYCHYNTVKLDSLYSLRTGKEAPQATVDKVEELVREISRELEQYGYDLIEQATSDESITEYLREDNEFYKDGTVA